MTLLAPAKLMRYAARQGGEGRSPTQGVRLRCYRPDVSDRSPTLVWPVAGPRCVPGKGAAPSCGGALSMSVEGGHGLPATTDIDNAPPHDGAAPFPGTHLGPATGQTSVGDRSETSGR